MSDEYFRVYENYNEMARNARPHLLWLTILVQSHARNYLRMAEGQNIHSFLLMTTVTPHTQDDDTNSISFCIKILLKYINC